MEMAKPQKQSVPYHINQHISSTQCVKPHGAVLSYSHFFTDTAADGEVEAE